MKEELLWGLLSFQCFLAASISSASSRVIPEILAAPMSGILWTAQSQLQNKIFFSFQMSFTYSRSKKCCCSHFAFILSHTSIYMSQSLASLIPSLRELSSAASPLGHKLLASCTKEPTPPASWDVTATYITQTHTDVERQPVSFRGELLKSTENLVAFQLLGNQRIFSLI